MHQTPLVHVSRKSVVIDLLHFENTDNELVTNVAENSSVALPAELLQIARTATVIVIEEGHIEFLVPFARSDPGLQFIVDKWPPTDGAAVVLFFEFSISCFE